MDASRKSEPTNKRVTVERKSERELVVTRTFDAPARLVFEAWTRPELFKQWWVPKSMGATLQSCEMDVRVGGRYRLGFGNGMDFFGRYLEVTPHSRLVRTTETRVRRHFEVPAEEIHAVAEPQAVPAPDANIHLAGLQGRAHR